VAAVPKFAPDDKPSTCGSQGQDHEGDLERGDLECDFVVPEFESRGPPPLGEVMSQSMSQFLL
jgi:hypothetical protein